MKKIAHALAATVAVFALAACEVPEDSGTAADKAEVNNKSAKKADTKKADKGPKESVGQENARQKAEEYLDYSSFSRTGLIDQLKFEGFNVKDATYGVDAQKADWNKQAAAKAEEYLETGSFSREGLIDQLVFEGFTRPQAEFGVKAVGL